MRGNNFAKECHMLRLDVSNIDKLLSVMTIDWKGMHQRILTCK